jgi:tRNA threonylcarbamoyladenosine biosynthesis protein TsaE
MSRTPNRTLVRALPDSAATEALGAQLAPLLRQRPGGMIWLEGDLGAGKTTLARALLRALGVQGAVRSPTYTLVEPYELEGGLRILHLDLYRLAEPEELYGLGVFDDAPPAAWWLVEWPQRGQGVLPAPDLHLRLATDGEGRRAELELPAAWGAALAAEKGQSVL